MAGAKYFRCVCFPYVSEASALQYRESIYKEECSSGDSSIKMYGGQALYKSDNLALLTCRHDEIHEPSRITDL